MKHYDLVEWKLFKEDLLQDGLHKEMEEHLINCDECMELFLSLIDDEEIKNAETIVPKDFTLNVMKSVSNIRPIEKKQKKVKKSYSDFFIYYVAVAAVAIILTASGVFGKMVDSIPQIAANVYMEETGLKSSVIYDFSKKITEKTNGFVKNFNLNRIKED